MEVSLPFQLDMILPLCSSFAKLTHSRRFLLSSVRDEAGAMQLLSQIRYSGLTPLGTSLDKKILQPLVLGPARAGRLEKPVLIIAIVRSLSLPPPSIKAHSFLFCLSDRRNSSGRAQGSHRSSYLER